MPQVETPSHVDTQPTRAIELPPLPEHVKQRLSTVDDVRFVGAVLDEDTLVVHVCGGVLGEVVEALELLVADAQRVDFHHSP